MSDDMAKGCNNCPARSKCEGLTYRGSDCAALRHRYGASYDPEIHRGADDLISRKALMEGRVENDPVFIAAKCAPAVDPHKHGRWIPSESYFDDDDTLLDVDDWCDWQCSLCHKDISYEDPIERRWLPEFCSHCGAKMDLEG